MEADDKFTKDQWGPQRFGLAIRSETGRLILKDLSPAIANNENVRKCGLGGFVGDKKAILDIQPGYRKIQDQLSDGLYLILHCICVTKNKRGEIVFITDEEVSEYENADKEGKEEMQKELLGKLEQIIKNPIPLMTPKEICNFVNASCPDSPLKLEESKLQVLGAARLGQNSLRNAEMFFAHYIPNEKPEYDLSNYDDEDKDIKDRVHDMFSRIKKLKDRSITGAIKTKAELEKVFKSKGNVTKLDDNSNYLAIEGRDDELNKEKSVVLANKLNKALSNALYDEDITVDDVVQVGNIMKKNADMPRPMRFVTFAIKVK